MHHDDVSLLAELQPEGWGDILPSFVYYTKSSFCHPIKVVSEGKIAGIGAAIIHHDVAWLAQIIVHPENRSRGLGRLITRALVDLAGREKCETIYLIATDLGAPLYEKLGFETETDYLFFKDISIDINTAIKTGINIGNDVKGGKGAPDSKALISKKIEPYRPEYREQILRMDSRNSGEDRAHHLEEYLADGLVYVEKNVAEGFYLPTFGQGLIIADSEPAGLDLLKMHLQSRDNVVFPKDNLSAVAFLYGIGCREYRTAKRMRLGKERNVKLANIYSRIGGNLG